MINFFQKRFALSRRGAVDLLKGAFATVLLNLSLMLAMIYLFIFLNDYLPRLRGEAAPGRGLIFYLILAAVFLLITTLCAMLQYHWTYTAVYKEGAVRRITLAEKLRRLPLAFFGERNLSDLTTTIMADNTELETTFSHAVPQLLASLITIIFIVVAWFCYQWQLALAAFWVAPVAALFILFSRRRFNRTGNKVFAIKREVSEEIQEGLENIGEIKACGSEKRYNDRLDAMLTRYEKKMIGAELGAGIIVTSAQSVLKFGMITVIIVGARLYFSGEIGLFTYLASLLLSSRIYDSINLVFNYLALLFHLGAPINRMKEIEATPIQSGATEFAPDHYDIEFEQVDFSYETGRQVLRGVSFTAKQGEITALIGPSGGGKSTAAKLAARFWDVDAGRILLGGHDISAIDPETLLKSYSVVFQDVVLFNATVMENIRIGKREASDEEVLTAARLARCDDFVNDMPQGYQTVVGENGATLSGGERQRLSIARALLKDAPIILLDEATASIDVENESKIQAGISELIKNKTVLIIAHRMRTVAGADKIVALSGGAVAESGKPDELRAAGGLFARMIERQMGGI